MKNKLKRDKRRACRRLEALIDSLDDSRDQIQGLSELNEYYRKRDKFQEAYKGLRGFYYSAPRRF